MKSLLIVEDDKYVRQEICTMVRHSGVPVDIVLECADGGAALAVVREKPVDVVFTDIHMPVVDGFQLVEELKKMDQPPLIVAISRDNDFSSAVRMLRNGVREYFLKPLDPGMVQKVMWELNEEIEQREKLQYTERKICEQWIRNLMLNDTPAPETIRLLEEKYRDYFFPDQYRVCACERDYLKNSNGRVIVLDDVDDGQICLISEQYLRPFLRMELSGKAVGISEPHHGLAELRNAYVEVCQARQRAFCTGQIICYGENRQAAVPKRLKEQAALLLEEKSRVKRIQLIGTEKSEELFKQWKDLFDAVKTERISPELFLDEMSGLLVEIGKIYRNIITEDDNEIMESYAKILAFDNLQDYEESFLNWLSELNVRIVGQKSGGINQQKIKQALEYIEQNYNTDLNMAVVSNYISMNYSLFSLLFKQYTGTKFVNYLKDIRIREAKRLLSDTDMKIAEISQSIGYDNEKNFMKVFKAACGVSPTEYRRNMKSGT